MKQLKKRVLLTLMSVMTIICLNAQVRIKVNDLFYTLSGTSASVSSDTERPISPVTYEHITHNSTYNNDSYTIPSIINYNNLDYSVTTVSTGAFSGYKADYDGLSPNYYYRYDYTKGNGSTLNTIILPESLETIESYAFANCAGLKTVTFSTTNKQSISIGNYAFYKCKSLVSINLSQLENTSLTLGDGVFDGCEQLTRIIIPSSILSFGYNCFSGCSLLRSIIYLSTTPPLNWIATSNTYVPNKKVYGTPKYSINNASIIEMITFSQSEFEYTGEAPNPTWTNNVEGYTASFTMPTLQSEVGSYEEVIPVTFTKGEESFTANIPYSYTIEPVKLKAKVNNTNRTYGEPNPEFTISYSGFVNGENESILMTKPIATTSANEKSSVGTYPITISGGAAKNYTFEYEQGELTINKASLAIQVMDANKVYGSNNPSFSLSYTGLKNSETIPTWISSPQYTTAATKKSGVGTYDITVVCEPKNYEITSNTPGKLTIQKASLTVKANNATMDYCGTIPTYSFTYSGFVNNDTEDALSTKPSIATEATATSNAGTYTITPERAQANNYDFSYTAGTLTVKKRPLTVKANSVNRLYGENNPDFTVEYEGFVNDETKAVLEVEPTVSTTATIQSNAGSYDIRVSGGQAQNYSLSYQTGQLSITPRPLKAFVDNYERAYGENNPTFEILYEGLAGNDTGYSLYTQPIARCSATRTSNVGTYTIEVTGGYSPNYTLTYGSGQLTIVKAEQTFTWNQDLTNLKVGDQVELLANASSNLPISFTMDSNDYAEIYKAGSRTYMECKKAGSFHIKAVQEGNDNYYSTARINKDVTIVGEDEYKPTLFIKQADNGMVSTKVEKGSSYTFTIHTESGWKIHSVTFNDNDVTNKLDSNNSFTTPEINESSTLSVVYEQEGSSVNMPQASEVKIQVTSYGIRVTGVHMDDVINVYAIDGILLESVRAQASQVDIPLHKDKVYVVKVGTKTMKLRL